MSYRTVEFRWLPDSKSQWEVLTHSRLEAARLWADLVVRHARIRRLQWNWPPKGRWEQWAKKRYRHLHSQSVQQIIGEFLEAVDSTRQKRKNGDKNAHYPWRKRHYRDVIYTNQAAKRDGNKLILPNGKAGKLVVTIPDGITLPGRIMEVRLEYNRVLIACELPVVKIEEEPPALLPLPTPVIGVDLGVNTLIAATDGVTAVLVSGRELKATVQWRNKRLASLQKRQSTHKKRSRRHKRLQRRKYKMLEKARNRVRDATHKATRIIADAFPNAQVVVGKPFNDAAQKIGSRQAQQVSSACNRKIIQQLSYKLSGAIEVSEAYTSQTCPVCGTRHKCRRTYRCTLCSHTIPRDVVGALNIRRIGMTGAMMNSPDLPTTIKYQRPVKVFPKRTAVSSGGHPASSS